MSSPPGRDRERSERGITVTPRVICSPASLLRAITRSKGGIRQKEERERERRSGRSSSSLLVGFG